MTKKDVKLTKEEFRKEVKRVGYRIRFKIVGFPDGNERYFPVIWKGSVKITGGSVFTQDFLDEHKEVLALLDKHKMFPTK